MDLLISVIPSRDFPLCSEQSAITKQYCFSSLSLKNQLTSLGQPCLVCHPFHRFYGEYYLHLKNANKRSIQNIFYPGNCEVDLWLGMGVLLFVHVGISLYTDNSTYLRSQTSVAYTPNSTNSLPSLAVVVYYLLKEKISRGGYGFYEASQDQNASMSIVESVRFPRTDCCFLSFWHENIKYLKGLESEVNQ